MGIRVIENELYGVNDYNCSDCFHCEVTTNSETHSTTQQQEQQTQQQTHLQHQQFLTSPTKDLVGNSKEFRIENNKCHLRIIGNSNRIRITNNSGNLQIIGNSTRLKIIKNSGNIKYTGNDGRICLGSESIQQTVDYIGCNGILKVINSMELNKSHSSKATTTAMSTGITKLVDNNGNSKCMSSMKLRITTGNAIDAASSATTPTQLSATSSPSSSSSTPPLSPHKLKVKSASYGGVGDTKNEKWQRFNEFLQNDAWQQFAKISLPDLQQQQQQEQNFNLSPDCDCKCKKHKLNSNFSNKSSKGDNNKRTSNSNKINANSGANIVNNFGNIIIKNSVNVSIA